MGHRVGVAVVLAVALATSSVHANGRPPLTSGITFKPGDPHAMYVRTTAGLLISPDDGCTMYWVCADNVGYGGTFDPVYRVASDGSIFAATYAGLRVSRDGGCSFTTNASLPHNTWVASIDIGPTGEIWIGTATSGGANDVYVSRDNGETFASRNRASSTIWWKSVRVAPSNPLRVYVGGYQVAGARLADGRQAAPIAHLERSDDDGATWVDEPLHGVKYAPTPILLVAAVDPRNADLVYTVSAGANAPSGDLVYRSTDGGATFAQILATSDGVRDVVIESETNVIVATQLGGSFESHDGGVTFSKLTSPPQLSCLARSPDGSLVGCGANWQPDHMALARSSDDASTWRQLWRFVNLYGPLQCPAGTAEHDVCARQQWPALQQQFGASGPSCGSHVGQTAAKTSATVPPSPSRGCCDAGADAATPSLLVVVVLGVDRARRRRAARSTV